MERYGSVRIVKLGDGGVEMRTVRLDPIKDPVLARYVGLETWLQERIAPWE